MDDIKLYASKKNHILSLLTIIENLSNDIGMSFGIDKCKTQSIDCRGKFRICNSRRRNHYTGSL
jgi:hypothetical protein